MEMKTFKGKAIYNPQGAAGEYSYWGWNFYKGCSNGCTYCYLRKGVLKHECGGGSAKLKSCFKDEEDAMRLFKKELLQNLNELQKHGMFNTFTSDPFLPETYELTIQSVLFAVEHNVPVKLLSKRTDYWNYFIDTINKICPDKKHLIAIGYTLTGMDEEEPFASPNIFRVNALEVFKVNGFKTFASIEPVIDFERSLRMIEKTVGFCDLYKIGLESGKKYGKQETYQFMKDVVFITEHISKVYFKDGLLINAGVMAREVLPKNCVTRDYNLFR
jgi:DNA repair photolyase